MKSTLSDRGGSRKWARFKDQVVSEEPICWLRLPGCTIQSQTADHYWPRKYRPDLVFVRSNARGSCNRCNRARRATLPGDIPKLRAKMEAAAGRSRPAKALGFFS